MHLCEGCFSLNMNGVLIQQGVQSSHDSAMAKGRGRGRARKFLGRYEERTTTVVHLLTGAVEL